MKTKILTFLLCCFTSMTFQLHGQTSQPPSEAANKLEADMIAGRYEVSYYNTACYFALAGKTPLAFLYLSEAVENGFASAGDMEKDTDLTTLHSDPRWPALMKEAENNDKNRKASSAMFYNQKSFWNSPAFATPFAQNISENEKIAGLSKLWSEVKYNFVNFDLIPDVNFDSLYLAYIPKVRQTKSTFEYYRVMQELVAYLRDGHTNVNMP